MTNGIPFWALPGIWKRSAILMILVIVLHAAIPTAVTLLIAGPADRLLNLLVLGVTSCILINIILVGLGLALRDRRLLRDPAERRPKYYWAFLFCWVVVSIWSVAAITAQIGRCLELGQDFFPSTLIIAAAIQPFVLNRLGDWLFKPPISPTQTIRR